MTFYKASIIHYNGTNGTLGTKGTVSKIFFEDAIVLLFDGLLGVPVPHFRSHSGPRQPIDRPVCHNGLFRQLQLLHKAQNLLLFRLEIIQIAGFQTDSPNRPGTLGIGIIRQGTGHRIRHRLLQPFDLRADIRILL